MTKKNKRLIFISGLFLFVAGAIALTLSALRGTITYFYMPSDLATLSTTPANAIRLGGLVADGSVDYETDATSAAEPLVRFSVTDGTNTVPVTYAGILPDLFREGQGVVVQGKIEPESGVLRASNVLAKHDENYMPREVADALKEQGRWQEETGE